MGNQNTGSITFSVDRPDLFYFTNEILSGTVDVRIFKEKLKFQEIYLQFIGCTANTTVGIENDMKEISGPEIDDRFHAFYASSKLPLMQLQQVEEKLTLYEGKHSWPFQIQIPKDLPPSINPPTTYPCVAYFLQLVIKKSHYQPNFVRGIYIKIHPQINISNNQYFLRPIRFEEGNEKAVIFRGALDRRGYLPGESMHISYSIENSKRLTIRSIKCSLVRIFRTEIDRVSLEFFKTTFPNINHFRNQFLHDTFSLTIPSTFLPPTYPSLHHSHRKATGVHLSYVIRFQVILEGSIPHLQFDVPFTLGTHPRLQPYEQLTFNSEEISSSSEDDQPPSYDTVVQHE